jgi:voltage-gated potassium channel
MTESLATQLVMATVMAVLTVMVHLLGLSALIAAANRHSNTLQSERALAQQMLVLVGVSFGLFVLSSVEIWSYATLYMLIGAIHSFEDALYFSTATYSTIGYGDLTLPRSWRLLGAMEGANGVILLGWSTAFFISVVSRIRVLEHNWSSAFSERTSSKALPAMKSPDD